MSNNDRNLHILIIPSWYPAFEGDIGGSFFREQAHALKKAGNKVGVIYPQFRSITDIKGIYSKPYGIEYINDQGLPTYKYHHLAVPKIYSIRRARWVGYGLKLFDEYTKQFGLPDIIHVHSSVHAGHIALEIKSRYSIPYVVTEHSSSFARGMIKKNELLILKNIITSSDYNIAVSQPFCNLLNRTFKVKSWNYIPNIVNNAFFNEDNEVSTKTFKYLSVSFLSENKAIDNLIKAFSFVSNEVPNAILYIGGDGEQRSKLEQLVKDLNLEDKVIFLGKLSRERVKLEMARSSVFVLPSRYETFGVVLVEALALGKPVIATKCGGPESIVNNKVGTLVEVDNIEELSKAMLNAYTDYNKYKSEDIRQYCIDNFSEEAVTAKLTEIYYSVVGGWN